MAVKDCPDRPEKKDKKGETKTIGLNKQRRQSVRRKNTKKYGIPLSLFKPLYIAINKQILNI